MKVYKEKQFLIFDLEDGSKSVKYDFANKKAIGKRGKCVNDLKSQLRGITIQNICESCVDKQYGKFLRFVQENENYKNGVSITNIGTILERVPLYSNYEQIFSAGIDEIVSTRDFIYTIKDIPKGLIKISKEHNIKISNDFLINYNNNKDAHFIAYTLKFISLNGNDIYTIFTTRHWKTRNNLSVFNNLINEYNYNAKNLLMYFDYLKTFEAIDNIREILTELLDYVIMMEKISNKYDKYPRHFLTTHRIAIRNYNRLCKEFKEEAFRKCINKEMEVSFDDYVFIYPKSTQEIKDEAVSQNNCVASYIDGVLDKRCDILFLRKKDSPNKSLVTIEVRDNKIVQAKRKFNNDVYEEEQLIIDKWNKWWNNKIKNKKKGVLENAN